MAINTLLNKYDIFYRQSDGSELGFMLAKYGSGANKGVKMWRRDDEKPLPDSFATGDISYANLSPDIQKIIAHRYMNGGLGALEFEVEDDAAYQILRYLRTKDIDNRCRGKSYPGPKIVSLTLPVAPAPSIVNADFETDVSPAEGFGWTIASGDWTRSNEQNHTSGGTYSWKNTGCVATEYLRQTLADAPIPGVTYTVGLWVKSVDGADKVKIDIYDGVTETSGTAVGTTGTWVQATHSKTFAMTANTIRIDINVDAAGAGNNIYVDDATISASITLGAAGADAVFNGKYYKAFGRVLAKLNDAGTAYTIVAYMPFAITDLVAYSFAGTDYLFIALAAANKYYYMVAAETFTLGTIADGGSADKFCKVGTDLWQLVLPNKIRKAVNPLNGGSWGAEITVGEAAYNVNDLQNHDGYLYCMKKEGPFYESGGSIYEPFPELETLLDDDSGKNSVVFRDGLYFRMGNQQEFEIKDGVLTEITPELSAPGIAEYAYECVARAHDESWLYTIIKRAAGDLAVLAGRWEYIAGQTRWIWHEIRSINLTGVGTAFVCSVGGRPYLYLGSTDSTENVYKVYLPVTNDATADTGYRFHTAGSLWTPRYMSLLFAATKRWVNEYLRSVSLSATNYINVYYSINEWATSALLKKFATSPEQTEAFTSIEATMMNLRFDFVGDSETVPPVLKYHNLKALTMMPSVTRFRHRVECADGLTLKANHKASPNYTATAIRTFIDGLRDNICTLGDPWGAEFTVKVRVLDEQIDFFEDGKRIEGFFDIEAVKL